jgi:hypothetical protein
LGEELADVIGCYTITQKRCDLVIRNPGSRDDRLVTTDAGIELRQDDPAGLAAVSAAFDLLGKDGPALGPPLVSAIASMTAIHAGLELLRECDPGFQFSADNVERTVAMSYFKELRPTPHGSREPRVLFAPSLPDSRETG